MSHTCSTLILHCMDFRLGHTLKNYMTEKSLLGDTDIVSLAGAAKNILSETERDLALKQIEISRRLHGISKVLLVNHTDCGAYGGRAAFPSREEEIRRHAEDLKAAANEIRNRYPDLTALGAIAHLGEDGSFLIEEIAI